MEDLKLLSKLKDAVNYERSLCKSPRGVNYSSKVIKLTKQIFAETKFNRTKIKKATGLSNDFVNKYFVSVKPQSVFTEVKINKEAQFIKTSSFDIETPSGLKIKNVSLEMLIKLEKQLSCY